MPEQAWWSVPRAVREAMDATGAARGAAADAWHYASASEDDPVARAELERQLVRVVQHATNAATLASTILDRLPEVPRG